VGLLGDAVLAVACTPLGRRGVTSAIRKNARLRAQVLHALSNDQIRESSFGSAAPRDGRPIEGFEDCAWLFSSNVLNHGLSRQEFAEAAYLYRLVRGMAAPRVIEVGRYKGGTTFLLAAAGAHVISLDIREATPGSDDALRRSLERFGLGDRVEIVLASSQDDDVDGADHFDLVFLDGPRSYDDAGRYVARWWPRIAAARHLIIRDGCPYPETDVRASITADLVRVADDLDRQPDAKRVSGTPGTYAHFVKVAPIAKAAAPAPSELLDTVLSDVIRAGHRPRSNRSRR